MKTGNARYAHHPDARWREFGERIVVLHQRRGVYYTLNELGAFLWRSMDGRTPLADILDKVVAHYDVDRDTARGDLLEILQDLVEEGLVTHIEDGL